MKLLMCPPRYYGIEYEINPWMSRSRQSDPHRAQQQWQRLFQLLQNEIGIEVNQMQAEPALPDMVFTANAGFVWGNKFIVSNFRHQVRRGETPHFEKWFKDRGYLRAPLPPDRFFEGEGDLLMCGENLFAGYHIRSDIHSHQKVAEILEREILSLELTNPWFYHLDTCFCPLGEDRALYYPAAFDAYALKVLENNIPHLMAVTEDEARRFACNAIVFGQNVVMNDRCPRSREQLEALGYFVFEVPLGEFIKAGGSAKCLVLRIPHCE